MTVKTYDTKCRELAEAFLSDEPHLDTTENAHKLALLIQQAIEDFIEQAQENYDGGEP